MITSSEWRHHVSRIASFLLFSAHLGTVSSPSFAASESEKCALEALQNKTASCDKAIANDPDDAANYVNRAFATASDDDAISYLGQAIKVDPTYVDAYVNRYPLLLHARKFDAADRDFRIVLSLQPENAKIRYIRACALAGSGDFIGAHDSFVEAEGLGSHDGRSIRARSCYQYYTGDRTTALHTLSKALENAPTYVNAWIVRASVAEELGDFNGALADLDRAISLNPDEQSRLLVKRVRLLIRAGKLEQARAEFVAAKSGATERLASQLLDLLDGPAAKDEATLKTTSVCQNCNLQRLQLVENANFSRVRLSGSDLALAKASSVHFKAAVADHAIFYGAMLTEADFSSADLSHAEFSMAYAQGANFQYASLIGVRAEPANFAGADFQSAKLRWVRILNSIFTDADLIGADLSDANLRGSSFTGANLTGIEGRNAIFSGADMRGATLVNANLVSAEFVGANLAGADLRGADLYRADLRGANLSGAKLAGAILTDSIYDETTIGAAVLILNELRTR